MKTKTEKREAIHHPLKLYTDGGVISKNPSPYGGTWAWVLVQDDVELSRASGIMRPTPDNPLITNNQTELLAIISGMWNIDYGAIVEICSDSSVSLGRVFRNSSFSNIPDFMIQELKTFRGLFFRWKEWSYALLDGHPTKAQLASGVGKHGHPVSKWNKLCDDLCRVEADNYWKNKNR